jgi:hypothetical protein
MYGNGAWQPISGTDGSYTWPPSIAGGTAKFQLIAGSGKSVTSSTLPSYMENRLQTVTGPTGASTRALYSVVNQSVGGANQNWDVTQNDFIIFPQTAINDLYIRYWMKLPSDLLSRMTVNNWAARGITDWKTGPLGGGGGDRRFIVSIYGDKASNKIYWYGALDNVANLEPNRVVYWEQNNTSVPVPVGAWFKVEVFVHRSSGSDGRLWFAVNGQTVFDRYGSNIGPLGQSWNRIMAFLNYSSGMLLPSQMWVDDFEVWNGFPSDAAPH